MRISKDTVILSQLSVVLNGNNYVVGIAGGDDFYEIPPDGARLLSLSNTGPIKIASIAEESGISLAETTDFFQIMAELNLIKKIDGIDQYTDVNTHISNIYRVLASLIFSKITFLSVTTIFLLNIINSFYKNSFEVKNSLLLFTNYPGINILVVALISTILVISHEFGHFLGAVKYNVPVKFNLSTRLFMLVVEAKMNGVWSVEKKNQYIPLLGGMYFDLIALTIIMISVQFYQLQVIKDILFIGMTIIFSQFLFQFAIFLRTDMYFILINYLGIDGLQNKVLDVIKGKNRQHYAVLYTIMAIIGTIGFLSYFSIVMLQDSYHELNMFYTNLINAKGTLFYDSLIGTSVISFSFLLFIGALIRRIISKKVD